MVRGVRTGVLGVGGACPPNNNLSIKHAIRGSITPEYGYKACHYSHMNLVHTSAYRLLVPISWVQTAVLGQVEAITKRENKKCIFSVCT